MEHARVIEHRLRSHLLSAPAPTVAKAAEHMLATQGQEFWGGRWALAARTTGDPSVRDVDAAFERREIVRSDPIAEMFARFIASHGPAGARDFAWWSALPLGMARRRRMRHPIV